jgi:hypothetical protein
MCVYVWHDGRTELSSLLSKLTVQHGSSEDHLAGMKVILRWCGDDRVLNKKKSEILNHSRYTNLLLDNDKIHSTLHAHAILYDPPQRPVDHLLIQHNEQDYLIPVFLMDALAVLQHEGNSLSLKREDWGTHKFIEVPAEHKTGSLRKLERYAVRAVYALGLDYACVYVRVQRSGRAGITRIDVNPIQMEQVNDFYAKAINQYGDYMMSKGSEQQLAVFGMDPEFLLRNRDGKIVPASRYLRAKGDVGYDSATVFGRKQTHPLAELRPEPSENVTVLVNNLRRTMWVAAKQITDHSLQWIAGGMPVQGLPLGGHLHISGIKLHSRLIRALDNYLALPLIMIEDTSTKGRRKKYGRLGDVRRPFHGGFEYRTLPSWIVSPRVTKGVFALTHLIVQHYEELVERPLDHLDILIAYKEGNKQVLEPIVRSLWRQLEATAGYIEHRMQLEPLKDWIMEQRIWNEQADFRAVWRVPPFH